MNINLSELSLAELHDLIANVQQALIAKQKQERKHIIAQMQQLADSIGVTIMIQEAGKPASKTPVAAKYRNPRNPSQTWSGRGMKPRWLVALLDEGLDIQDCLI
jgi:DNA-binding protein H-NS